MAIPRTNGWALLLLVALAIVSVHASKESPSTGGATTSALSLEELDEKLQVSGRNALLTRRGL